MRRALLVLVLALAAPAHAESKLGFRLGGGQLPIGDESIGGIHVALGTEYPLLARTRALAEYEWMWLAPARDEDEPAPRAEMGHRAHVGIRHTYVEKRIEIFSLYVDVEAGGGLGRYAREAGPVLVAHGFAGLRCGYRIRPREARAARELEVEILARVLFVEDGLGFAAGLGFFWTD